MTEKAEERVKVEPEQDKSMARLERILEENGIWVTQCADRDLPHHPFIEVGGDKSVGLRAVELAKEHGYLLLGLVEKRRHLPRRSDKTPKWELSFRSLP